MPAAHNLKVLVVDDQQSMRGLTRYCLNQIGIRHVEEAKSGVEALQSLMTNKFDIVVSDWNMDGMDGLDLLKTIRANPVLRKLPFVMSTGQKDSERVKAAIQAGVNNYIVKPFNVATLKEKLEKVLGPIT